ncbi:hypothetical protein G352_00637 [Rhodococcus ruber BKS 20-38]|uniref:Uncharacterized protein n=1 Tax=Rhodococcus ruber BKS 20-38 TaxID=1278076 RepID=M2Y2N7_9NOCA|nr:hypothetical protein G352_00637 [Rhodococcus ruber BKS 20-38]
MGTCVPSTGSFAESCTELDGIEEVFAESMTGNPQYPCTGASRLTGEKARPTPCPPVGPGVMQVQVVDTRPIYRLTSYPQVEASAG